MVIIIPFQEDKKTENKGEIRIRWDRVGRKLKMTRWKLTSKVPSQRALEIERWRRVAPTTGDTIRYVMAGREAPLENDFKVDNCQDRCSMGYLHEKGLH